MLDSLLCGRRLTRIRKYKIYAFLRQMAICGALTIRFPLTIWSLGVENVAGAGRMRFHSASVHKIDVRGAENYRDFQQI